MIRSQMTFRNAEKSPLSPGNGVMLAPAISEMNVPLPTSWQVVALSEVLQCVKLGVSGAVSSWKRALTVPTMRLVRMTKRTMMAPVSSLLRRPTPRRFA